MSTTSRGNRKKWEEHVRNAAEHRGSLASYCRVNGVNDGALRYWRKKLESKSLAIGKVQKPTPFIPVHVLQAEPVSGMVGLPDPKWVAELILHLSSAKARGGR